MSWEFQSRYISAQKWNFRGKLDLFPHNFTKVINRRSSKRELLVIVKLHTKSSFVLCHFLHSMAIPQIIVTDMWQVMWRRRTPTVLKMFMMRSFCGPKFVSFPCFKPIISQINNLFPVSHLTQLLSYLSNVNSSSLMVQIFVRFWKNRLCF